MKKLLEIVVDNDKLFLKFDHDEADLVATVMTQALIFLRLDHSKPPEPQKTELIEIVQLTFDDQIEKLTIQNE